MKHYAFFVISLHGKLGKMAVTYYNCMYMKCDHFYQLVFSVLTRQSIQAQLYSLDFCMHGWMEPLALYFTHALAKCTETNTVVATENRPRRDSHKQSGNSAKRGSNLLRHFDYLLELYYPSEVQSPAMIYSLFMQAG